jgi:hypothetical protein
LCYEGVRHRSYHNGHFNDKFLKDRKKRSNWDMKKPMKRRETPTPGKPFKDSKLEKEYPCLYGMLVEATWDGGEERKTSTLLFFVEDGQMKACLNDRALEQSAFFCGNSMEALLTIIEEKLLDESADFRPYKRRA